MDNLNTHARWLGVAVIATIVVIFIFEPYYLSRTENPDIKIMTSDVLISGRSFKNQDSKALHLKYGCKFWRYQEKALDLHIKEKEFSILLSTEAKEKATEFLTNYAEIKSKLESKHSADQKAGEVGFLTTIRQTEMRSLERDLETNKASLEYLPMQIEKAIIDKTKLEVDKKIVISMANECAVDLKLK